MSRPEGRLYYGCGSSQASQSHDGGGFVSHQDREQYGPSRFPVDPEAKKSFWGQGGAPQEKHVGRCQRKSRTGEQCRGWAVTGSRFCLKHTGRRAWTDAKDIRMGRYTRQMSTQLKERLEEAKGEAARRSDLADEVDLARVIVTDTLRVYDAAHSAELPQDDSEESVAKRARLMKLREKSSAALRESLADTASLVERMQRVYSQSKDVITPEQVGFVIAQIIRVLRDEITEDALFNRIQTRLDEIRLPDASRDPRVRVDFK